MKKYLRYGLFGILFYLLFLVITLPAAFLLDMSGGKLGPASPYGVEGSVWSGKASLLRIGKTDLEQFRWNTSIFSLFTGALELGIHMKYGRGHARGDIGLQLVGKDRVYIEDLKALFYVEEISSLLQPSSSPIQLSGKLTTNLEYVSILPNHIVDEAVGTITWKGAKASLGPEELPLGNFNLTLTTEKGIVTAKFKDQGKNGPIEANLVATMAQNGDITINGKIGHRPNAHKVLMNLLKVPFAGKSEKVFNVKGNINNPAKLTQALMK